MAKEKAVSSSSASHRPLYDVLGVSVDSDTGTITRAYRRLALEYHPDRNQGDAACTEQFKKISEAYSILSDETQRRIYDRTGQLPSGSSRDGEVSAAQRSVEVEDQLQDFFAQYRGSEEEKEDVIKQFQATKGDFKKMILERLLFDNTFPEEEVERLYAIGENVSTVASLRPLASTWAATSTPVLRKKYIKRLQKERKEAEEALKELGQEHHDGGGEDSTGDKEKWKRGEKESPTIASDSHSRGPRRDGRSSKHPSSGVCSRDGGETEKREKEGLGSLQVMMRARQQAEWNAMISHMEGKYVKEKTKGPKKRRRESEEEAEKIGRKQKKR